MTSVHITLFFFIFFATSCEAGQLNKMKTIEIGVVSRVIKHEDNYTVLLDNGVSGDVPLNHPIRAAFLNQPISFPHFKNDAVALITYTDGTSDWLPARIAVSVRGEVVNNKLRHEFNALSFEEFSTLSAKTEANNPYISYAYVTSMPVPSPYCFFFDSQFAKHNYTIIKEIMSTQGKISLVDIVYSYTRDLGYSLVYIQPTRFTEEYCKQVGIPTSR